VCGIALGVAVVFAIAVLNRSVLSAFRQAVADVSGRAALCVGRGTGLPEQLLERVRAVPGVAAAAPVIEDTVRDETHSVTLAVLGVDTTADHAVRDYEAFADEVAIEDDLAFLNDAHGVLVTRTFWSASRLRADALQPTRQRRVHGARPVITQGTGAGLRG
jgi:ABC-type lipoprotein release transport system permease subunit